MKNSQPSMRSFFLILFLFSALSVKAQFGMSQPEQWTGQWISVPEIDETGAGLYLFRKTFDLESIPDSFTIRVSGDNKYKLFVNEQLVSVGPSLGDLDHWNYETVDLLPYLKTGDNIIAAKVWNEGDLKPVSQFSLKTGFIVQGESEAAKIVDTNDSWKCTQDFSFTPIPQRVPGYYAAGAGEFVDMTKKIPSTWRSLSFNDDSWVQAKLIFERTQRGLGFFRRTGWQLQPSIIPGMELSNERLNRTRKTVGVSVPSGFPAEKVNVQVPANTKASILLDQNYLTNAFFTLIFSGGKDANVNIRYAEALYGEDRYKGNRDEIEGKTMIGRLDSIMSSGAQFQEFISLSYRTYRYVQLDVTTKSEPLTINDVYGTFIGYPFEMKAVLTTDNEEMDQIMDIGWRTARLCAVDTYMDCPFYERLQYVGDTRIQHFVSFYMSGDDRLAKNALNLIDQSRKADGYTLSRYPDTQNQVIPTYSLWHVSMLYDYMMYGSDPEFVKPKLLGTRQILNYFITYIDEDGSLKNVPGWNYTDWVPEWQRGTAPMAEDGSSAALDLQLLHAFQSAIELEKHAGSQEFVDLYESYAKDLEKTIMEKYWDESAGLFADTPEKDKYSQHANSLALLAGLVDGDKARVIGEKMLSDTTMAPASIYFKYYLHLALSEAGLGNQYLDWLDIWRKNIDLGLTTWGETSQVEDTRSDCHAWGSSPNVEFFRIILGIESAAPNFSAVNIEPNLGEIDEIAGTMPHPQGEISVDYKQSNGSLKAIVTLPENVTGKFFWNNQEINLKGGKNELSI
ncbi:alpha-L-rhamnosidase C-terminal domain-containing protein [uncultured Algoriphagus sp.]|uniref:alpha-L-rhamnosidase-related protein n=1 Tax=uncultured Algoriphagus sp. TaxID=417365 RepID=UPI00258EC0E2|nr:alpha-L-rhamnosidase C-terminal domain-containing protein [uncultured Algoriphagus sp.]